MSDETDKSNPDDVTADDPGLSMVLDKALETFGPAKPLDLGEIQAAPPEEAPAEAPSWVNWNWIANSVADAQGIEPGSWTWMLGGMAAFSGSSGSQASYGWRHDHKLNRTYTKSVIANYGHRRAFYALAPFRQFGYEASSRPHGWTPEMVGDQPDGTTIYVTSRGIVRVSGPDAEHFWLNPLWALIDDPSPISIPTGLGTPLMSDVAAKLIGSLLVSAAVGMVRDKDGGNSQRPYPWLYGDRANSRLLDTMIEGFKRGCMLPQDETTAVSFMQDVLLPFYERAPGISRFGGAPAGQFPIGTFNGLYWIMPACYTAAVELQRHDTMRALGDRFMELVKRWSQWALDIEETVPGRGFDVDRIFVDKNALENGVDGVPLPTLKPLLDPGNVHFSDITWEIWSFRAADIAAKLTGNPVLEQARDGILNRHGGNQSNRQWMVDADGNYAV